MTGKDASNGRSLTRRRLLQVAAGSTLLAGCNSPAGPVVRTEPGGATETPPADTETATPGALQYHGISFDRVVDAVADLGFDDTGSEPIDEAFAEAYRTGTLIEFPPGEYLVEEEHSGEGVSRFGIRGTGDTRRDVRLTPTEGTALMWLRAVDAGPHLLENLSFDERSDDSTQLSVWLQTTGGSVVREVEWLGRTPADSENRYSLAAECVDEAGVLTIDGIYAGLDEPAKPVDYPNGVEFVRAGPEHLGEVVLRNPVIHGRNSSATRYTRPPGVLTIVGGEFVNNQNANIRFGAGDHPSKVSSATGCHVRVDAGSDGTSDAIRVDASQQGYAGAIFRGITVEWEKTDGRGVISVPQWGGHGSAAFFDCVVYNGGERTPTVSVSPVPNGDGVVQPPRKAIHVENCSFTGPGQGFICVDRPGSEIVDSCIDMANAPISGFETSDVSRSDCRRPSD